MVATPPALPPHLLSHADGFVCAQSHGLQGVTAYCCSVKVHPPLETPRNISWFSFQQREHILCPHLLHSQGKQMLGSYAVSSCSLSPASSYFLQVILELCFCPSSLDFVSAAPVLSFPRRVFVRQDVLSRWMITGVTREVEAQSWNCSVFTDTF